MSHHGCMIHVLLHMSIEGKALPTLKDKNKKAAEKWRRLSQDEKRQYVDAAKEATKHADIAAGSWGEATRILHNMQSNVCFSCCVNKLLT